MEELCLAVDIGGTKLAAGLVGRSGRLTESAHVPTDAHTLADAEELWDRLAALVGRVAALAPPASLSVCGVGCGGPMAPGGSTVSPLNIGLWRDFPLRDRLAEATSLPTAVDNDAKALALGEHWQGAGRGHDDFVAIVVSTGIGGGIVLDGRLLDGRLGNAGHIGHVVVEPDGRRCPCGGVGCLEAEASGSAIAAITGREPKDAPPAVIERTGTLVGRAVASVANLLDLPLAVVAGSVALGYGDPFFSAAQAEIERRCRIEFARGTTIVPAGLGAAGPLVGAGAVGWRLLDGRAPGR